MSQNTAQPVVVPVVSGVTSQVSNGQYCGGVIVKLFGKAILGLGIAQIVLGIVCLSLGITWQIKGTWPEDLFLGFASGIISGVLSIVAGSFGVVAGVHKRFGLVVTCMVLSIISAVTCLRMFIFASMAWSDIDNGYFDYAELQFAINTSLIFLGLAEAVVAIVTASLSCCGVCGCCHTGPVYGPGVQVMGSDVQAVVIQGNPGAQQAIPVNSAYMITPQGYDTSRVSSELMGTNPGIELRPDVPLMNNASLPAYDDLHDEPKF